MKHCKKVSAEKPMKAQEAAWIQLYDLIGKGNTTTPAQNLWLAAQWDNWLQK
jgi:hypothetical protein